MLNSVIKGLTPTKPSIVLYGEEKIGKSRLASEFPNPIFIDVEDGLNFIETTKTPVIKSYTEAIRWLDELLEKEHNYETVVIDSADWLEEIIGREIAHKYNAKSIDDPKCKEFAYGVGYKLVGQAFIEIFKRLDLLKAKGVQSVLICHSKIKTVDNPVDDKYEKYVLKLNNNTQAKIKEWADLILFAKKKFYTTKDGKTSDWKPVLLSGNNPAFEGGGRMKLPEEIELNYNKLKEVLNDS